MRRPKVRLPVIYADDALSEIDAIADWNEDTYNRAHAQGAVQPAQSPGHERLTTY